MPGPLPNLDTLLLLLVGHNVRTYKQQATLDQCFETPKERDILTKDISCIHTDRQTLQQMMEPQWVDTREEERNLSFFPNIIKIEHPFIICQNTQNTRFFVPQLLITCSTTVQANCLNQPTQKKKKKKCH